MHLALGRYGKRFATGGGTAGHGGESKRVSGGAMSEQELLDIFDARANMEAMWSVWRLPAVAMNGRQTFSQNASAQ